VPAHPVAREIIARAGRGVIAPSANRFGHVSATAAEHVAADLGDAVDMIVDAGPATVGVESTIVDLAHGAAAILRPGAVTREQLEATIGPVRASGDESVRVPGSLPSHYAPRATVELADDAIAAATRAGELRAQGKRVTVIARDSVEELARQLYALMRAADDEGSDAIVVVAPRDEGLGAAVSDRLRRAASRPAR
ncbi:MAG: Sua5/YciO/YrdC/YwlC family protein, partial [Candidatus Eremiobacteraeota bacterium]|nr:Sua5/YciO/YrdC/YwlC family protein [Candidatus Eremiobacteraeota bacterium]